GAANSAACAGPWKKCQNRSRRTAIIAKIKMIRPRIDKNNSALNETQPKQRDIEIETPLRITRDRGDVMKAGNLVFHHIRISTLSVRLLRAAGVAEIESRQPLRSRWKAAEQ